MTEWGVVGVIIAMVGLIALLVKPMLSLNTSITRLTTLIDGISDDMKSLTTDNKASHDRIWRHNDQQDAKLEDHEKRIHNLEHK